MTTTTNTPTPTGLDLVIERLRALTAELQQQQAAAAAEPAAPLPVVLTAPEPEQEELDQTELANALIQDVNEAVAPEVARLIRERVSLWLHRNQLEASGLYPFGWPGAVRADVTALVLELKAQAITRAKPKAPGGHQFRLT
jgi:hypothetical protein